MFGGTIKEHRLRRHSMRPRVDPRAARPPTSPSVRASLPRYDTVVDDEAAASAPARKQLLTSPGTTRADPTILILDRPPAPSAPPRGCMAVHSRRWRRCARTDQLRDAAISTIRNADTILVMEAGRIVIWRTSSGSRHRQPAAATPSSPPPPPKSPDAETIPADRGHGDVRVRLAAAAMELSKANYRPESASPPPSFATTRWNGFGASGLRTDPGQAENCSWPPSGPSRCLHRWPMPSRLTGWSCQPDTSRVRLAPGLDCAQPPPRRVRWATVGGGAGRSRPGPVRGSSERSSVASAGGPSTVAPAS